MMLRPRREKVKLWMVILAAIACCGFVYSMLVKTGVINTVRETLNPPLDQSP